MANSTFIAPLLPHMAITITAAGQIDDLCPGGSAIAIYRISNSATDTSLPNGTSVVIAYGQAGATGGYAWQVLFTYSVEPRFRRKNGGGWTAWKTFTLA